MNRHEAAILAIKLMALFFAFGAISSIQSIVSGWYGFPSEQRLQVILLYLLSGGISLGIGLLIWISAEAIAQRIFPSSSSESTPTKTNWSSAQILEVAFTIIGMWLVVHALPILVNWIAMYAFSFGGYDSVMGGKIDFSQERQKDLFDIRAKANIVSEFVQLILGIMLLFGHGSVAALLRIRTALLFTTEEKSVSGPQGNDKKDE